MAPDPSSPASIATAEFTSSRRGYDQNEVRGFLKSVSLELSRAKEALAELASELSTVRNELEIVRSNAAARAPMDLDEATVTSLLGEEAARVLTTAREGAAQLRARVEAESEADRRAAAAEMARQKAEADEASDRLLAEAAATAEGIRLDAAAKAEAELDAAKSQGRDMVFESRAYREKVMADLTRRRDAAQQQLDVLNLQRARLRSSFDAVRAVLDDIREELDDGELGPSPLDDVSSISGSFPVVARVTARDAKESTDVGEVPAPDLAAEPDYLVTDTVTYTYHYVDVTDSPEAGGDPLAAPVDESAELRAVSEPEPQPEAESAAPIQVEEIVRVPTAKAPDRSKADDVFARLRAQRIDDVARLQEAPAPSTTIVDDRTESVARDSVADEAELSAEIDAAAVVEARSAALLPIEGALSRRVKRVLADEQSEVLDALRRRTKKTTLTFLDLFGTNETYVNRYGDAVRPDLVAAARLGAVSLAGQSADAEAVGERDDVVGHAVAEFLAELVVPLRDRLERAFIDAGEQSEAAGDHFRAIYREWKTQRIDDGAADATRLAYGRGAFAALAPGTPICWLVDPGHPCAEGDDNVLGGVVPAGGEFPTGHRSAPAYSGCRCAIALARR